MKAAKISSAEVWLVDKATNKFSSEMFGTHNDSIFCLLYYHLVEHLTLKDIIDRTIKDINMIWSKSTQRIDSAERKLKKLYDKYQLLMMNGRKHMKAADLKSKCSKST